MDSGASADDDTDKNDTSNHSNSSDTPTARIPKADSSTSLNEKRILIVDDEPLVTRSVAAFLARGGFANVFTVNDSREAIDAIRQHRPDMILLDIFMPHMDGLEVLAQISNEPEFDNIVVLILSAAGEEVEDKSYELGALGFLPKPATPDSVVRVVASTFRIANRFGAR